MCGFWPPPIVELQRAIREGRLRADLYYRLNVVSLELPPLRDRIEDVLLLAEEFVRTFNREHRKAVEGIAPDCLDALKAHSWPGNVRELRNAIERAVIMSKSPMLSIGDLPKELSSQPGPRLGFTVRLGSTLEEVENELIARTILFAGGNKSRAAQILGVGRRTLYKQPERYKRARDEWSFQRPHASQWPKRSNVTDASRNPKRLKESCGSTRRDSRYP